MKGETMTYNITQEQYNATVLNMVYSLSNLINVVPTEETIEKCKKELLNTGKIHIIDEV